MDDFEDCTVAPPPPPPTKMPVPSSSIEDAANAAAEMVLETQCSSSESCADNGSDAVNGDRAIARRVRRTAAEPVLAAPASLVPGPVFDLQSVRPQLEDAPQSPSRSSFFWTERAQAA